MDEITKSDIYINGYYNAVSFRFTRDYTEEDTLQDDFLQKRFSNLKIHQQGQQHPLDTVHIISDKYVKEYAITIQAVYLNWLNTFKKYIHHLTVKPNYIDNIIEFVCKLGRLDMLKYVYSENILKLSQYGDMNQEWELICSCIKGIDGCREVQKEHEGRRKKELKKLIQFDLPRPPPVIKVTSGFVGWGRYGYIPPVIKVTSGFVGWDHYGYSPRVETSWIVGLADSEYEPFTNSDLSKFVDYLWDTYKDEFTKYFTEILTREISEQCVFKAHLICNPDLCSLLDKRIKNDRT